MTNRLPLNWCECILEDVCSLENGIKSTDLNLPLLDAKYLRGKKESEYRNSGVVLNSGNYVILVDGENSGEIFSIKQKGIMGSTFKLLNFTPFCKKEYILYFIHSYQDLFRTNKKGAAIPHLNKEIFRNLELPVPPLAEQGRIVDRIEEIFAKIDAGVEKLKSAQEKIKQYKQSVLHSAFTGKLEKVSNWKHAFLKEICNKITDGSHFSPESDNSYDYPYITVKDIFNDNIMFSSAKKIKKIDYEKLVYNGCKPNIGDVLFSKDGTVGKVSLIQSNINFVVLSSLAILTPNYDKITSKFLFYMLKSPEFLSEALKNKTGVAIRRIILATLKNIKVFYPSDISEQERIVEEIEKRFAKADKMLEVVEKSLKFAEQLKQSVLKKAFEGKLVPQNPNDEPASVLLERIKSEKQQNEKAKGKRNDRK